jgi:Arc/MetJ family transcription regulator
VNTKLDVPTDLVEEARRYLGFKSRTDTVVLALRELVRREQNLRGLGPMEPLPGGDPDAEREAFRRRLTGGG